jgi:hypothetical protein
MDKTVYDTRRDLATCFTRKIGGGATMSDAYVIIKDVVSRERLRLVEARLWVMHVASLRMLHREKAKDGRVDVTDCVGPFYLKIIVSSVLVPRGTLIF